VIEWFIEWFFTALTFTLQVIGTVSILNVLGPWVGRNSPAPPIADKPSQGNRRIGTLVSIVALRPKIEGGMDVWNHITVSSDKDDEGALIEANLNYANTENALKGYTVETTTALPIHLK
jgi:hypothetical protein